MPKQPKKSETKAVPEPNRKRLPTFRREYATHIVVSCDDPVITLDFGQHSWYAGGMVVIDQSVGVVMPVEFAKKMTACIQEQIDAYEKHYGKQ